MEKTANSKTPKEMPKKSAEEINAEYKKGIPSDYEEDSKVFILHIKDKTDLYSAYMPFVLNGGLFIRSQRSFNLEDEILMSLQLPDETEKHRVAGRVIWITPPAAQGGRPTGVGVQFVGDNAEEIRGKIETTLAGGLKSERQTDTM